MSRSHAPNPILPPSRRWLHRWAVLTVCATLPLILLGGSVTSFNAGMAAPDYPTTFGQSLLAFFFEMWDKGRDLILEHGHRTYGALVGLLTVVLAGWTWLAEPRRGVRWLAGAALAGVIVQGLLGGLRVVLVERGLAFVHGLAAQAFFALLVCFAVVTAPGWIARRAASRRQTSPTRSKGAQRASRRSLVLLVLVSAQLPLGALIRHTHWEMYLPSAKAATLALHALLALLVLCHAAALAVSARRAGDRWLRRPASILVGLIVFQALLGTFTWATSTQIGVNNLVEPTLAEVAFGTLHVAVAALILATACLLALRWQREGEAPAEPQPAHKCPAQAQQELRPPALSSEPHEPLTGRLAAGVDR